MLSHWAVLAVVLGLDAYGGLGLDSADVLELLAKSPESSGCGEADHRAGQRRSQASPPPPRRRQDRGDPGRATPPQLTQPDRVAATSAAVVRALVAVIATVNQQITTSGPWPVRMPGRGAATGTGR
jgi:hypothetical protein